MPDVSEQPGFAVNVAQNQYLPPGGTEVHAVVTVTSDGGGTSGAQEPPAEVIILDTSGSMYGDRLAHARKAACVAVDTLREGARFALVAGNHTTTMVYPARQELATATPRSRAAAKEAVRGLTAEGGTRMGRWVEQAAALFSRTEAELKHAILLTDGENNDPYPEFARVLAAHEGEFVCDCRGVGTDWDVGELREVASALLGSVGIVTDPAELADDFRTMTRSAMGKTVADVELRLWTPRGADVVSVRQVSPTVEDVTSRRRDSGPQNGDYPTGSWGVETREYHVCVSVPPADTGRRMRAGRVSVRTPRETRALAYGDILAEWTENETRTATIEPRVAHYTGQVELAAAVQEGLRAREQGDTGTATARLGRAVALAHESGNETTAALLARVVDVVDPVSGTVRLRPEVAATDAMALDTRSTRTVPIHPAAGTESGQWG